MRAAPGAIAVGRAARAEDERRGRGLGGAAGTVREDEQAPLGSAGGHAKRVLRSARKAGRKALAASRVAMPRRRNALTRRSCGVCQKRSMRPLAWGECVAMRRQQAGLGHFLSAHRERLPCLQGVTLFLNSYGMTFL